MKQLRIALLAAAILFAALAFGSPIYGTWTGERNAAPVSITFTRSENHTQGNLTFAGTNGAPAAIGDFHMVRKASSGVYPFTVSFVARDSSGKAARYEMEQTSPTEATLRNVDDSSAPVVKLTKAK